jgi:hypothetical protein
MSMQYQGVAKLHTDYFCYRINQTSGMHVMLPVQQNFL